MAYRFSVVWNGKSPFVVCKVILHKCRIQLLIIIIFLKKEAFLVIKFATGEAQEAAGFEFQCPRETELITLNSEYLQ